MYAVAGKDSDFLQFVHAGNAIFQDGFMHFHRFQLRTVYARNTDLLVAVIC